VHRRYRPKLAALVSASKDGALLAAVLGKFWVDQLRGSSSRRGPQALLELTTLGEMGYDLAVTPDGPRAHNTSPRPASFRWRRLPDFRLSR